MLLLDHGNISPMSCSAPVALRVNTSCRGPKQRGGRGEARVATAEQLHSDELPGILAPWSHDQLQPAYLCCPVRHVDADTANTTNRK